MSKCNDGNTKINPKLAENLELELKLKKYINIYSERREELIKGYFIPDELVESCEIHVAARKIEISFSGLNENKIDTIFDIAKQYFKLTFRPVNIYSKGHKVTMEVYMLHDEFGLTWFDEGVDELASCHEKIKQMREKLKKKKET